MHQYDIAKGIFRPANFFKSFLGIIVYCTYKSQFLHKSQLKAFLQKIFHDFFIIFLKEDPISYTFHI